jgi:hypothetical protein
MGSQMPGHLSYVHEGLSPGWNEQESDMGGNRRWQVPFLVQVRLYPPPQASPSSRPEARRSSGRHGAADSPGRPAGERRHAFGHRR